MHYLTRKGPLKIISRVAFVCRNVGHVDKGEDPVTIDTLYQAAAKIIPLMRFATEL